MDEGASIDSHAEWTVGPLGVRSAAMTIVVGTGVLGAARGGVSFLAPLLVSVLLAYAIEPFVNACSRLGLARPLGIIFVYSLLMGGLIVGGLLAQRQVVAFVDTLPVTVKVLQESMERAGLDGDPSPQPGAMVHLQEAASEIRAAIDAAAPRPMQGVARVIRMSPPFSLGTHLADASVAIGSASARLIAVAILTPLLLFGGEGLKRKVIAIGGERAHKKLTYDVIKAIDRQIEKYLVARALISGIVAAATWFALWMLGVRQPLVLGSIAGVLNIVPFIGPAVAVALAAIVAFVQFHTIGMTAAVVCVTGAVAAVEGNLISPLLTGRAGELNTVAVFVSVLFWGWMWDVWGLVLAVPIMVAIKAAADHIEPLQSLGEFLGR
jgi:predicted PurR-regulated permease PerM